MMKKLGLATAIALLGSSVYAQDGDNGGENPQPQQTGEDLSDRPVPDGFQGNYSDETGSWTSYTYRAGTSKGCFWHVHVDKTFVDGHTDWYEYNTKVPCDDKSTPAPLIPGAPEKIYYVTPPPKETPHGDPPPEQPPPPAARACPPDNSTWSDWDHLRVDAIGDITYYYKNGMVVRCRDN
ncbi:MAG TPA: hypothetical protein VEK35_06860, partial [Roseiarcus sp.]|nr:hypothetical protein [Roseiarcus sp.]